MGSIKNFFSILGLCSPNTFSDEAFVGCLFRKSNPDFLIWAFGENYEKLNMQLRIDEWNERHGHIIYLTKNMPAKETISNMSSLWIKEMREEELKKTKERST